EEGTLVRLYAMKNGENEEFGCFSSISPLTQL
ncbi:hypothetical protein EVA_19639, partial [gut metagenome]